MGTHSGNWRLSTTLCNRLERFGTEADRERSAKAGFRHHLIKPVSLDKLAAVLDEAVMDVHGR